MTIRKTRPRRAAKTGTTCNASGWTLAELLVVLGILGVLLTMLLPSLSRARELALDAQCRSNLRQCWQVLHGARGLLLPEATGWTTFVMSQGAGEILKCPKDERRARLATTGVVVQVDTPPSVRLDSTGSRIWVFAERTGVTLARDLPVNASSPGTFKVGAVGDPIPAGTIVDSYFLHLNGPGGKGAVGFPGRILGAICGQRGLYETDGYLGAPGTAYPVPEGGYDALERGFEPNQDDAITLDSGMCTLSVTMATGMQWVDQVRVLVESGSSPMFSYGMNAMVRGLPQSEQVLLAEYELQVVHPDVSWEDFDRNLPRRHFGRANTLFGDGSVRPLSPEQLSPKAHDAMWKP